MAHTDTHPGFGLILQRSSVELDVRSEIPNAVLADELNARSGREKLVVLQIKIETSAQSFEYDL